MRSDKPEAFENEKVKAFVHDIALHIAAFNPMFLDQTKPSSSWIQEQKDIFQKQVELDEKMKSKPDKVIQGILAGKLKKLMSEISLLDQGFVKEEKTPVAQAMADNRQRGRVQARDRRLCLRKGRRSLKDHSGGGAWNPLRSSAKRK